MSYIEDQIKKMQKKIAKIDSLISDINISEFKLSKIENAPADYVFALMQNEELNGVIAIHDSDNNIIYIISANDHKLLYIWFENEFHQVQYL